jgi:CubicO group peptidase (beta-lactamase class C family)
MTLVAVLLGTSIYAFRYPLFTGVMLEIQAHLDDPIADLYSESLGPAATIKGAPPEFALENLSNLKSPDLASWIQRSQTQVLLIQHKGVIVHEYYANGTKKGTELNGFSMAKSIVALLIGIAIDDGRIDSEHDSITHYLPEITLKDGAPVSLKDMLQQVSGMRDRLVDVEKTLAGQSLEDQLVEVSFGGDRSFAYSNINYHLLSLVLQRVYNKPLNEIFEEKLWQAMNLEQAAIVNSTGYCCLFASARTWLALGELFLHQGQYQGRQIVSADWIQKMINEKQAPTLFMVQATSKSRGNHYGYHIYSGLDDFPDYYWMEGMGLQLVMINPSTETIIVRLGDVPSIIEIDSTRRDKNLVDGLLKAVEHKSQ